MDDFLDSLSLEDESTHATLSSLETAMKDSVASSIDEIDKIQDATNGSREGYSLI